MHCEAARLLYTGRSEVTGGSHTCLAGTRAGSRVYDCHPRKTSTPGCFRSRKYVLTWIQGWENVDSSMNRRFHFSFLYSGRNNSGKQYRLFLFGYFWTGSLKLYIYNNYIDMDIEDCSSRNICFFFVKLKMPLTKLLSWNFLLTLHFILSLASLLYFNLPKWETTFL